MQSFGRLALVRKRRRDIRDIMKERTKSVEGTIQRSDRNLVWPGVKRIRLGLEHRIQIDGRPYFFDSRGFSSEDLRRFIAKLRPGTSIHVGAYRRRGHDCISWAICSEGHIAPQNVIRNGLFGVVGFILGLGALKLFCMLMGSQFHEGILGALLVLGQIPLLVVIVLVMVLGLLLGGIGIIDAFNPRKLLAMVNYRREVARRIKRVQA